MMLLSARVIASLCNKQFDNHSPDMLWSASEWLSNTASIIEGGTRYDCKKVARRWQEGGKLLITTHEEGDTIAILTGIGIYW